MLLGHVRLLRGLVGGGWGGGGAAAAGWGGSGATLGGSQLQAEEYVVVSDGSVAPLAAWLLLLVPGLVNALVIWRLVWPRRGASGTPSLYLVFFLRIFNGFAYAVAVATIVDVVLDSGLGSPGSVAVANGFRLLLTASSIVGAMLADRCLGSVASAECSALLLLHGFACYALAAYQHSPVVLFPGLVLIAAGMGTLNIALPVLGMRGFSEEDKAERRLFLHQYFLLMMGSLLLGNATVSATWKAGAWVAPAVAFSVGGVALAALACFKRRAESAAGSAAGADGEGGGSNEGSAVGGGAGGAGGAGGDDWSRLAAVLALLGAYYVAQQQSITTWYLQARRLLGREAAAAFAPSVSQAFFYATMLVSETCLTTLLAVFRLRLPAARVRCAIGAALGGLAVLLSALLELRAGAAIWWQAPQFIVLGLAEAVVLPAQLELLSGIAPKGMKHLSMSVGVLGNLLACGFLLVVEPLLHASGVKIHGDHGAAYLGGIALLNFLAALAFLAWWRSQPQQTPTRLEAPLDARKGGNVTAA